MSGDRNVVRPLYRWLLRLYPRAFQGRMGESMEQTFDDMWAEQRKRPALQRLRFGVWLLLETAAGASREHAYVLTRKLAMRPNISSLKYAALVSSALVLPLLVLELINTTVTTAALKDLIPLFVFLWVVAALSVITAAPALRYARGVSGPSIGVFNIVTRLLVTGALVVVWGTLVADQMPCFLGVPNCD